VCDPRRKAYIHGCPHYSPCGYYKKWLRYYPDFCRKYDFGQSDRKSLTPFIDKLKEKKQTNNKSRQLMQYHYYMNIIQPKMKRLVYLKPIKRQYQGKKGECAEKRVR